MYAERVQDSGWDTCCFECEASIPKTTCRRFLILVLDYLALESLLNLFATLLPPPKSAAKRSQFIESVFGTASPTHISCGKELTDIVQKSPLSDWEITSARIIETLAKNDIALYAPCNLFFDSRINSPVY